MFTPPKKMVVEFYADVDFAGLCGHENPQDTICARSIFVFGVMFAHLLLLSLSKLQTDISPFTRHYECVELYHFVR